MCVSCVVSFLSAASYLVRLQKKRARGGKRGSKCTSDLAFPFALAPPSNLVSVFACLSKSRQGGAVFACVWWGRGKASCNKSGFRIELEKRGQLRERPLPPCCVCLAAAAAGCIPSLNAVQSSTHMQTLSAALWFRTGTHSSCFNSLSSHRYISFLRFFPSFHGGKTKATKRHACRS